MRKHLHYIPLLLAAIMLTACGTSRTVPIVGRTQHLLVSDSQVLSLSNEQYQSYMKTAKKSTNATQTALVQRCGTRLAEAVEDFLTRNGMASELKEYAWEFNLVQDASANAFCLPGGKIVVYEGILPYTQTEDALAIVLGHEIAHAVAKHSAERLSKQVKAQYGSQILSGVLSGAGTGTQVLAQEAFGLGAEYGYIKPFSRKQESEADRLGLIFAAMAGYNPQVAVAFWQRMSQQGSSAPVFMSDHPSDEKRIKDIQKWMPEALQYAKSDVSATSTAGQKSTAVGTPIKATKTYHFKTK